MDLKNDITGRVTREQRETTQGTWGTDYDLQPSYDANGNITELYEEDGGKDYHLTYDPLNRLISYIEDSDQQNIEKGTFSYNCKGLLKGKEVDGDITKFEYDPYNVLKTIIEPAGDMLEFNFDLLGRLRRYWTSARDSGFNYEGSKRLGDYDDKAEEWKRYHWCKTQLLGYADDTNTYYIVPDVTNSTKIIMNSSSVVNRLDYDHLGYLRSKTTDPQVELLWRNMFILQDNQNSYLYKSMCKYYISLFGVVLNINNEIEGNFKEDFGGIYKDLKSISPFITNGTIGTPIPPIRTDSHDRIPHVPLLKKWTRYPGTNHFWLEVNGDYGAYGTFDEIHVECADSVTEDSIDINTMSQLCNRRPSGCWGFGCM